MSKKGEKKIITIDFETDPFEHGLVPEPFVAGVYDGDDFFYIWGDDCPEYLAKYLYRQDARVYAHNGGRFDYFYLLPWLERNNISVINGRISQAKLGDATLYDSYNIIPVPLKAYKKDDIEYWKMHKDRRDKYRDEILHYLEGDCVYLHELVTEFINRFGKVMTLATASMKEVRRFIKEATGNDISRFSKETDEEFRHYYYGGRCEAIKTGVIDGPLEVYDINSAYPYAMLHDHPDPTNPFFTLTKELPENLMCYFAKIVARSYGALPYRCPETKKLLFPRDGVEREYLVTGHEINAGLDTGTLEIIDVLSCRVPETTLNFSGFVNHYYAEKLEGKLTGDLIRELFSKLLLNSGYGKFGMNPEEFKEWRIEDHKIFRDDDDIDPDGWTCVSAWPHFGIDIVSRPTPKEWGYYNVSVASSITGFVRAFLWRALCGAIDPVYCDTDSIVCRSASVPLGDALGLWKHEGTAKTGYIAGRKMYALDMDIEKCPNVKPWKVASKGARLNPDQLKVLAENPGAVIDWINEIPTFSLRHGTRFIQRKIKQTS